MSFLRKAEGNLVREPLAFLIDRGEIAVVLARLVADGARRAAAERRDARAVHDAGHRGLAGCSKNGFRSADVDTHHQVAVADAERVVRGKMENGVCAFHRILERVWFGDIARHERGASIADACAALR